MNGNLKPSDRVAVVATIDPDATAPSTVATNWVSAVDFHAVLALIAVGALGSGATVDAKFEQALDATGTGSKDIEGKAISQLSEAGDDDSDQQVLINLFANELDSNAGFTHMRLSLTVAGAACDVSAHILGFDPRMGRAEVNDASAVVEVV